MAGNQFSSFTFCSITCNQEKYILDNLSSIKYQIEKYGQNIECFFILADDCSEDNTVSIVKEWLRKNEELFADIVYLVNKERKGTVCTYIEALRNISTEYFAFLSGDDLFYKNSIFDGFKGTYNICPTISFDDKQHSKYENNDITYELLLNRSNNEKLRRILSERLKLHMSPCAPSIKFTKSMVTKKVMDSVRGLKWIEDYPMHKAMYDNDDIRIYIHDKPLVLYRIHTGVSTNSNHENRYEFKREEAMVIKEICPYYKKNMYLNPYQYVYHFTKRFNEIFKYRQCKEIIALQRDSISIEEQVRNYLGIIRDE